jgi:hypothetical protein
MIIFKSLFVVVVSLILSTNAFSQEKPKTLPDDPLYKAKREVETAELNARFNSLEKANLHIKYAKERLAEIKALVSKGKLEFVEDLLKDYEKAVIGAMDEINKAQVQGCDVSEALEAVERSTKKHIDVLMELLGKVPEQAKPAIIHAIEVSKQGRNRALDVLNKIKRGELPIGKPESAGKPESVDKPERVCKPEGIEKLESSGRPTGISSGRGRGR